MPTGYTAKLMESGQTFPEFVMTCARAFGALIEMRDESLDAPIPDEFKPSEYHVTELEKAKTELARLNAMSNDERIAFGQSRKAERITYLKRAMEKDAAENERIDSMVKHVTQWTPPTEEHAGLKEFMLEQLSISRHRGDYLKRELAESETKSPVMFWAETVAGAERSVEYHAEEQLKEIESSKGRTDWVKQLRASLN